MPDKDQKGMNGNVVRKIVSSGKFI